MRDSSYDVVKNALLLTEDQANSALVLFCACTPKSVINHHPVLKLCAISYSFAITLHG